MDRRSLLKLFGLAAPAAVLPTLPAVAEPPAGNGANRADKLRGAFAAMFHNPITVDIYYTNGKVSSVPSATEASAKRGVLCVFDSPRTGTIHNVIIRRGKIGLIRVFGREFDTDFVQAGQTIQLRASVGWDM